MGLRQNGLVLPLTLVIAMIAAALGFALFKISRQQVTSAGFYSDKERAYHLAIGGLHAGRKYLENGLQFINTGDPSTFPKLDKAPNDLKPFTNWLLSQLNDSSSSGKDFVFDTPEIKKLVDSQVGSKIKLSMTLKSPTPIYHDSSSAIKADQREVMFRIILTSEATMNRAGVKVQSFAVLNWASVLPSVLGKFVLFLRQPPLDLNPIKDSNSTLETAPINIISGDVISDSKKWNPSHARDEIDRRGWIFFGSTAELHFGCSAAGGRPDFSEPLDDLEYQYELPVNSSVNIKKSMYFATKKPIDSEINTRANTKDLLKLEDQDKYSYSSSLNLLGSTNEPSPTFIIGDVKRRIILYQGFRYEDGTSYPMPYLDQVTYDRASVTPMTRTWPGLLKNNVGIVSVLYNHFEGIARGTKSTGFKEYQKRASKVIDYPMNEVNLQYVELPNSHNRRAFPSFETVSAGSPPELKRIQSKGSQVAFHQVLSSGEITIRNDRGIAVFENADLANFNDLGFFKDKARRFDDQNSFYKAFKRNSKLSIGGVAYIEGDLSIEEPIFVDAGGSGLILVEKDIKLSSEIKKSLGETLTLVSLGGNISIKSAKKIEAGLIAMQGNIDLPYALDIQGFIASETLKISSGFTAVKRRLEWDQFFDITDTQHYERSFKASITSDWNFYVSGI